MSQHSTRGSVFGTRQPFASGAQWTMSSWPVVAFAAHYGMSEHWSTQTPAVGSQTLPSVAQSVVVSTKQPKAFGAHTAKVSPAQVRPSVHSVVPMHGSVAAVAQVAGVAVASQKPKATSVQVSVDST
jgi:hypothetical protein